MKNPQRAFFHETSTFGMSLMVTIDVIPVTKVLFIGINSYLFRVFNLNGLKCAIDTSKLSWDPIKPIHYENLIVDLIEDLIEDLILDNHE